MSEAKTLTRRFRTGATTLEDPSPSLTPEQVVQLYVPSYPHLQSATIGEPFVEGDTLVYPLNKPTVQTKGAGAKPDSGLDALLAWANAPAPASATPRAEYAEVMDYALRAIDRGSSAVDPFLVPLA